MSDVEEVVLTRNTKTSLVKKDTKPEIARQKMKEKRERLKKEKEDAMINEAKRRLAEDLESKKLVENKKKQEEEEKLKNDPIHQIRMMLEKLTSTPPPAPTVKGKLKRQTAQPSQSVYVEPRAEDADSDSETEIQIPIVPKKRVYKKKVVEPKEPVEEVQPIPKASKPLPKPRAPRKKKVTIQESPSNQFYGTVPQTEPEEVYYAPTNPLLEKLSQRRRMGSYY